MATGDSILIGCERSMLERLSHSQARMGGEVHFIIYNPCSEKIPSIQRNLSMHHQIPRLSTVFS